MKAMKSFCQGLVVALAMAAATLTAQAGTVTYYHNDLAGSPVVATNASGQVVNGHRILIHREAGSEFQI